MASDDVTDVKLQRSRNGHTKPLHATRGGELPLTGRSRGIGNCRPGNVATPSRGELAQRGEHGHMSILYNYGKEPVSNVSK